MTTSSRKNYNVLALRGQQVDDMEYVDQFKLDPKLAYTPGINDAMLDRAFQDNLDAGMTQKEAMISKNIAAGQIRELMGNKK